MSQRNRVAWAQLHSSFAAQAVSASPAACPPDALSARAPGSEAWAWTLLQQHKQQPIDDGSTPSISRTEVSSAPSSVLPTPAPTEEHFELGSFMSLSSPRSQASEAPTISTELGAERALALGSEADLAGVSLEEVEALAREAAAAQARAAFAPRLVRRQMADEAGAVCFLPPTAAAPLSLLPAPCVLVDSKQQQPYAALPDLLVHGVLLALVVLELVLRAAGGALERTTGGALTPQRWAAAASRGAGWVAFLLLVAAEAAFERAVGQGRGEGGFVATGPGR